MFPKVFQDAADGPHERLYALASCCADGEDVLFRDTCTSVTARTRRYLMLETGTETGKGEDGTRMGGWKKREGIEKGGKRREHHEEDNPKREERKRKLRCLSDV